MIADYSIEINIAIFPSVWKRQRDILARIFSMMSRVSGMSTRMSRGRYEEAAPVEFKLQWAVIAPAMDTLRQVFRRCVIANLHRPTQQLDRRIAIYVRRCELNRRQSAGV